MAKWANDYLDTEIQALKLRSLSKADATELFTLVQNNTAHLTALGDYSEVVAMSRDETERELSGLPDGSLAMGIFFSGTLVGRVDLNTPKPGTCVLGYWISVSHAGRGFATAAGRALIGYAHEHRNAREAWAGVEAQNTASVGVLKKLGFRLAEELPTHLRFYLPLDGGSGTISQV